MANLIDPLMKYGNKMIQQMFDKLQGIIGKCKL